MEAKVVEGLNGNDWSAILDEMKEELPKPGEKDIAELMDELGKNSPQSTRYAVNKALRAGRLEKVWRKRPGKRSGWFYRPVK